MQLAEILQLRPLPGAGVFLSLTRRCPLACRHCSTDSLRDSEQVDGEPLLRFVDSFAADDRPPELILMTGGEPLLRPSLVRALATRARRAGARSYLLSGMFFVRHRRIPQPIAAAIAQVDHFAASLDRFHEEEVPREAVLAFLRELAGAGKDVSLQVVGLGPDDPYLAGVLDDARRELGDRAAILVGTVAAIGRARSWVDADPGPVDAAPDPCAVAAWPVVTFDGTIVGCCKQEVVDGPAPAHLRLGDVRVDGWSQIRRRLEGSALLRAVRTLGPVATAARFGGTACGGYCATCAGLSVDAGVETRAAGYFATPRAAALEAAVTAIQRDGGARSFAARYGIARYAALVERRGGTWAA